MSASGTIAAAATAGPLEGLLLKVCGMRAPENIRTLLELKPDFLGFIFYPGSARYVGPDLDAALLQRFPARTRKVGVFVNAGADAILAAVKQYGLEGIQLHGSESPALCRQLQNQGLLVFKAFPVGETLDVDLLKTYEGSCDYYLFDTKGAQHGGNGQTFNWEVLAAYNLATPFFLSGGIGPEHVQQIAKLPLPALAGLDINSRFETAPGLKDAGKVAHFFKSLKQEENIQKNPMHTKMKYSVDERGFYGNYGGAYIPEMLYPNVEELQQKYLDIMYEPSFQEELQVLLRDYVGRPTPLYYATRLSAKYNARIYLKREDLAHTGAHKINNTVGQILLAKRLGKTRIIAETGAGQHGVATATVCALAGLECVVYMGKIDTERQKPNVARMQLLGATVVPVYSGSQTLKDATNEAIRDWISNPEDTHYIIGSVVGPHPYPDMVARFQAVISAEMKAQLLEKEGTDKPDYVVACVGGGSNAAGAFYHFLDEPEVKLVAVEAAGLGVDTGFSAATSVLGTLGVIHGSKTLLMQTEDGQIVEPHSISAGLDYPGIGPLHAHLWETGRAKFYSITDAEAMAHVVQLSRLEGIIPAIESAHALAALDKMTLQPTDVVILNLSGRGDKDLETIISYLDDIEKPHGE